MNRVIAISIGAIVLLADALLSLAIDQPANRWVGTWQTGITGIILVFPLGAAGVIAYVILRRKDGQS